LAQGKQAKEGLKGSGMGRIASLSAGEGFEEAPAEFLR
jgi:hypothetical protein